MIESVVNLSFIAAALVLLVVWAVGSRRRRRRQRDRRDHSDERRLILAAITGAAASSSERLHAEDDGHGVDASAGRAMTASVPAATALDSESVTALLDLFEDLRRARRGIVAGLVTTPRSVWSAGARAGWNAGIKTRSAR